MTAETDDEARRLDAGTIDALTGAVDAAKARGWTQPDLRAWFEAKGVELSQYLAAKRGEPVADEAAATLAMVSITGLPDRPAGEADPFPDLPAEMKAARRWLLWRSEPNADPAKKPRKTPYYVNGERRHGALDTPEDVANLTTYDLACAALHAYTGLGFALGPDGTGACWQGIDLDDLDSHPGLQFVADDLPGYTERSPSGAGVHAIGYGRSFAVLGSNTTGIEAYAHGRYFTVTGESTSNGELTCLAEFVEGRLSPLHSRRPQDTSAPTEGPGTLSGMLAQHDLRSALASMRSDDRDLWVRMGHALKELGDIGRGLWLEWSRTSDKFDPADAARVWESLKGDRTGHQAVFAEAQRQGWANPAAGGRVEPTAPEPVDASKFAPGGFEGAIPRPRPWAYANFLMFQAVTGVAAPPGVGKTTFSFQIGLAYGLDMDLGPWKPAIGGGGRVWLYNGEEPKEELDRRFLAACAEMGLQPARAAGRVSYNSGLDVRLTLVRMDPRSGELIRSPDVDAIKTQITEGGYTLFIVDPLIEFHGAKEDTEGFHAIGAVLREIAHDCNCAVLFFHHTPKAANADTAAGDMNAMRGGGPIIGVARFVATMFTMTIKDAEEYGIPVGERLRYVRFDDAKANMTVLSAEPQWWMKLGVCIDNADDLRPADNIGVLRFQTLRGSTGPVSIEQTMARATARQNTLDKIAAEMARVCVANGHTTAETAASFDGLFRALDPVKTGVSVNTAKDAAMSDMGSGREIHGQRIVITTVPRGKLTVRKVHVEGVRDAD